MARGHKRFWRDVGRGFKKTGGVMSRGMKALPKALDKADRLAEKTVNFVDNVGQYAQLAGQDFGNDIATKFGSDLRKNVADYRANPQQDSALMSRIRQDLRR